MSAKMYCPLGKIDCKRFVRLETYREIKDSESFNGEMVVCGKTYFNTKYIEVCPCPSKQQKIERYDMCEDQPAQIICWEYKCAWNSSFDLPNPPHCKNISPAIILHSKCFCGGTEYQPYSCNSFKAK